MFSVWSCLDTTEEALFPQAAEAQGRHGFKTMLLHMPE
jgi:hypothetical protein